MTTVSSSGIHGGLADVLKRGVATAGFGLVICQLVSAGQMVAMARLLGPEQVGVFTAGSVAVWFLMVFAQNAPMQALVQREADIEDAANTVLVGTFVIGLLATVFFLAAAPLLGYLFQDSRVGVVAAATAPVMLLYACSCAPYGLILRAFQFKQRVIIDSSAQIVSAVVSVTFAVLGYGVWAMVLGLYASAGAGLVLSWWIAKWRPFRGRFSSTIWHELVSFSWPLVLDEVGGRAREMCEQVLVGRSFGTAGLGQYRYAYRIGWMPGLALIQAFGSVLYPAFARIAHDRRRFRHALLRALGWSWFAALPVGALTVIAGQPVVVLLLGNEWRFAGETTAAMAGIGLGTALSSVCTVAIKGAGRSSQLNWMTALNLGLGLGLVILLLPFGLVWVGVAISLTYLAVGALGVELARALASASHREILSCLGPTTLSALVAFAVVFPLERLVVRSDHMIEPLALAAIIAECALFMIVYFLALRVLAPSRFYAVRDVAYRAVSRFCGPGKHRQTDSNRRTEKEGAGSSPTSKSIPAEGQ
jgi:PST family polysaccharide transporter